MLIKNIKIIKKILMFTLMVLLLITNIYLYKNNKMQVSFIDRYYENMIGEAIVNIDDATCAIQIARGRSIDKRSRSFTIAANRLSCASKCIENFSIYYDYKDKERSMGGNVESSKFFKAYISTLDDWADLIYEDENALSEDEITNMVDDLNNIYTVVRSFTKETTYDELQEKIKELEGSIRTYDVKNYRKN